MKVKKFTAPTMPEAMKMIRAELGSDAVILNSKVVQKGGFFGFFMKKNIEVIAAIDPKPVSEPKLMKKELPERHTPPMGAPKQESREPYTRVEPSRDNDVLNELKELKTMMKGLSSTQNKERPDLPGPLNELHELLAAQEIEPPIIEELLESLNGRWDSNNGDAGYEEVLYWLKQVLFQKLSRYAHAGINYDKKYINVVGPTGVGKTTTLAKLAAKCVLQDRKKVAFITTDTYRIAAIEQLKTYAKILGVPLEVCYNAEDFQKAADKFREYDAIFIDTAGRNFRNQQYVEDLKQIIDFNEEMQTFLVLALTSKLSDMNNIFKQFSELIEIDKVIFTKIDETSTFGQMVNFIMANETGAGYLTNGQNVPDDIVEASPEEIVKIVLGVEPS